MILVDTSVWIDHLRAADEGLAALLDAGEVLAHPFVIGELALGNLQPRAAILNDLLDLAQAVVAESEHVLEFIERNALYRRGIGYVDAHLLASARLTAETRLWTRDRRLQVVATDLGLAAMLPY